jgi:hypothetical protein
MKEIMYVETAKGFSTNHFGGNKYTIHKIISKNDEIVNLEVIGHYWSKDGKSRSLTEKIGNNIIHGWGLIKWNFTNGKNIIVNQYGLLNFIN